MNLIKQSWIYWVFVTSRKCSHKPGIWRMINTGMGKLRSCKKCGKVLDII